MKKSILLSFLLLLTWMSQAVVSKTVNISTPGTLSTVLTPVELSTVTNLTITGTIDAQDFKTMRNSMTVISEIDLSAATIVEYSGSLGTSSSTSLYPANEIPSESFYLGKSQKLSLTKVIFPNTLTSIGYGAFYNCYNLTNVIIPETVTTINDRAFQSCKSFTDIVIPNSVTVINMILYDCSGLLSLTIGNAVTSITTWAFGCANLKTFNCLTTTPPAVQSNWFYGGKVTDVFVPTDEAVTAFRANTAWITAFPGSTIKKVGTTAEAFLSVSSSALNVSSAANSSTTFTITSNTSWSITSDQSVCVVSPTSGANNGTITVTATTANTANTARTANLTITGEGVKSIVITATQAAAATSTPVSKTVHITTAGSLSTTLTANELSTVANLIVTGTIDARDFKTLRSFMPSLASLDLSDANIAAYTGIDGTVGSNTTFPIHTIPENGLVPIAPYSVNKLTTLILPSTITSIGKAAFAGLVYLTSITISSSVTSIGDQAFYGCTKLATLSIPTSVASIGSDAFGGCINLTSITIPASVTTIGNSAFATCTGLTAITLPSSISEIPGALFYNCTSLKTIYCLRATPPTVSNQCFMNAPITDVFVPTDDAVSAYKANASWINYFPGTIIKKGTPSSLASHSTSQVKVYSTQSAILIEGTSKGEIVSLYNLSGTKLQSIQSNGQSLTLPVTQPGLYLVKTANQTVKVKV